MLLDWVLSTPESTSNDRLLPIEPAVPSATPVPDELDAMLDIKDSALRAPSELISEGFAMMAETLEAWRLSVVWHEAKDD